MPHLDATPENTNDEECATCKAEAGAPCVYSTNPPIARDRMHWSRYEAGERTAGREKREALASAQRGEWMPGDVFLDDEGFVWQRSRDRAGRYPWLSAVGLPDQRDEDISAMLARGGMLLARNGKRVS